MNATQSQYETAVAVGIGVLVDGTGVAEAGSGVAVAGIEAFCVNANMVCVTIALSVMAEESGVESPDWIIGIARAVPARHATIANTRIPIAMSVELLESFIAHLHFFVHDADDLL